MPQPFYPENDPAPVVQEAGWDPEPVWTGAEILDPTGIRSPNQPVVCRNTDYAIPAQLKHFTEEEINKYKMGRGVGDEEVQRINFRFSPCIF